MRELQYGNARSDNCLFTTSFVYLSPSTSQLRHTGGFQPSGASLSILSYISRHTALGMEGR